MKVAVSASGQDLNAQIDPRFGRCAHFIIVDTDDMSFEAFNNENIALGGGAGIQSAQFVASKGASIVITGNVGPNAVRTLSAAGVDVIVGQTGTVRQAIEAYKNGKLTSTSEPNVADHYGMQGGSVQGPGGGMGMGQGQQGGGLGTMAMSVPSMPGMGGMMRGMIANSLRGLIQQSIHVITRTAKYGRRDTRTVNQGHFSPSVFVGQQHD